MHKPLAIVSGGASGIGKEFGRGWVAAGGRIVLFDRDPAAVGEAAAELGADARGVAVDVRDANGITAAVARCADEGGGTIDAVVTCAGVARPGPSAEVSDEAWTTMLDVHLSGTMRMCRAAFPYLRRSDRAAVVTVSSVAAAVGMPGRASYGAAKAGIEALTRTLAVEWARDGIRVNAVAPGYVNSAMTEGLVASGALDLRPIVDRTPLRRLAAAREITAGIQFLVSPDASYITGHVLVIDGGMTVDGDWYLDQGVQSAQDRRRLGDDPS